MALYWSCFVLHWLHKAARQNEIQKDYIKQSHLSPHWLQNSTIEQRSILTIAHTYKGSWCFTLKIVVDIIYMHAMTYSTALHSSLSHLYSHNSYIMLFIDFSSAFNTVIHSKLIPSWASWASLGSAHPSATGIWTFWLTDPTMLSYTISSSNITLSTYWALFCIFCLPMTVFLSMAQTL